MIPITDLLSRFKNLTNTEKVKKDLVGEIITEIIGVPINNKQISFSKKTIFLKTHPLIKTEILFKKKEILEKLKDTKPLVFFSDIQ